MSVKFFGQYLVERGEIDAGQLREALERMQERNLSLGDLAIAAGLLSPEDATRLNAEQREVDRPFGELAVAKGLLSRELLERLVRHQRETRLPIGEALVALGHLSAPRLGALLDQFKSDQAPFETGQRSLPGPLVGERIAALTLDLMPRFCLRVARVHVKLAPARPQTSDPVLRHRAMLALQGAQRLEIGLAAEREVATAFASGVSGAGGDAVDTSSASLDPSSGTLDGPRLNDGLGEFLNLLVSNAAAALEREGVFSRIEPVRRAALPVGGFAFDWIATVGRGVLVIAPSALG